jgi:hypothetical protein
MRTWIWQEGHKEAREEGGRLYEDLIRKRGWGRGRSPLRTCLSFPSPAYEPPALGRQRAGRWRRAGIRGMTANEKSLARTQLGRNDGNGPSAPTSLRVCADGGTYGRGRLSWRSAAFAPRNSSNSPVEPAEISLQNQQAKPVDRFREVNRFGECPAGEGPSGILPSVEGQQPIGYNPRNQREFSADESNGELVGSGVWLTKPIWDPTFSCGCRSHLQGISEP